MVELAIRIAAFGRRPQDFFKRRLERVRLRRHRRSPSLPGLRENVTLLRLARLLRVVRLVSVMPDLRILVRAMARSLPPIASLALLTLLLMYVYGMVGWILFNDEDPEQWGNIGAGDAEPVPDPHAGELARSSSSAGQAIHPASWIFFVSYVLIASFLVINILIAIIINSMEEVHEPSAQQDRDRARATRSPHGDGSVAERLDEIRQLARPARGPARRGRRRPAGAARSATTPPDQGRADARLSGLVVVEPLGGGGATRSVDLVRDR